MFSIILLKLKIYYSAIKINKVLKHIFKTNKNSTCNKSTNLKKQYFSASISDLVKTITYKTKTLKNFQDQDQTFDFFQDQDHKNGIKINSLSIIAIFL